MTRIFPPYAYGDGPRTGCWWDETVDAIEHPQLRDSIECDVVIVGGGFTGLSAAHTLARADASVVVLEAEHVGWGASGRNGGFCCLGGGMAPDALLDHRYGREGRSAWRRTEAAAVHYVSDLAETLGLDLQRHSDGETCLAHSEKTMRAFEAEADRIQENYGVTAEVLGASDLAAAGMSGPFFGALSVPIGFGLNPARLVKGLRDAAISAGARIFDQSPVTEISGSQVRTSQGQVAADRIIIATNGYSNEDIPAWMAAKYMPAQSTVLVTRPISPEERDRAGWTTDQMVYDSRNLLHYFRVLPDGRFLFGMRGGLMSAPAVEARARARVERDFRLMFPDWADVAVTHSWSGMVCLARNMVPFIGPLPGQPHILAGFAYHGNGVAMGTYAGKMLADLALGQTPDLYPQAVWDAARAFPFGTWRRAAMWPIYGALHLQDRWS
ncbi:FAD-binding oxidoreductase [uncultured Tateyamaria sp.]|uniref:NAD(P)/FAD-dependent oxidoreductase n=1 Tax=uncultured Tateyamaria sp. TaxID=455651 RepID=UPI002625694E|nr:FAD-binding oxidoreductase [uncultured Tateyamaria sp.]